MSDNLGGPPHTAGLLDPAPWSPAVHAGLRDMLAGPPGVAAFDFDDTLLDGDLHISNRVVFARGDWVSDAAPNSPTPAAMMP